MCGREMEHVAQVEAMMTVAMTMVIYYSELELDSTSIFSTEYCQQFFHGRDEPAIDFISHQQGEWILDSPEALTKWEIRQGMKWLEKCLSCNLWKEA